MVTFFFFFTLESDSEPLSLKAACFRFVPALASLPDSAPSFPPSAETDRERLLEACTGLPDPDRDLERDFDPEAERLLLGDPDLDLETDALLFDLERDLDGEADAALFGEPEAERLLPDLDLETDAFREVGDADRDLDRDALLFGEADLDAEVRAPLGDPDLDLEPECLLFGDLERDLEGEPRLLEAAEAGLCELRDRRDLGLASGSDAAPDLALCSERAELCDLDLERSDAGLADAARE